MNGIKPQFLNDKTTPVGYYDSPDPYKSGPDCTVNLLELSKYAKKHNKKLSELNHEEVQRFRTE